MGTKKTFVDPNAQSLTPEERQQLLDRFGGADTLAANPETSQQLMTRDAGGLSINPAGGDPTGGSTEGGWTGQFADYRRDGSTFSRKREDGNFDSFDPLGNYISTSNDSNTFDFKDWATFVAICVGGYYATGGAAGGVSATSGTSAGAAGGTSAGAVDAAALGLDAAATTGGTAATNATMAEQMATLVANGVPEATAAEIIGGNAAAYTGTGAGSVSALSGGNSLLTEAGQEVGKKVVTDAAKDAIKQGGKDAAVDTVKDAAIDAAADEGKDGILDYFSNAASGVGRFITDNKLAPTLLAMGGGIISRYADAREQKRLTDEQRQRYQDGYKSGSGLSLWRSKAKKAGG